MEKETRVFQAETKQLLDLMVHSIYTHREIFLRELISNASDAIDKIKFQSLTNSALLDEDDNFEILISLDKDAKTITISDNGIGMTHDEVVDNIGTIARSGSKVFAQKIAEDKGDKKDVDLIGQFGVGFYSSFMVAERVTLITRTAGASEAVRWESTGDGTYTIEKTDRSRRGTDIILRLRESEESESHDSAVTEFLSDWKIKSLVKKYSDYIRYPVKMDMEEDVYDEEDKDKKEKKIVRKTLNSMIPLWKKDKAEIKPEDYNDFYKSSYHDWEEPVEVIHTKAEGSSIEYTALIYIPGKAPFDFYSKEFKKGLQLYSKNVFIMENCEDIVPDYFRFVKGLIDSSDFSLNISREILQQNRQLKTIAKNVEKKISGTLTDMLKNDREKYEKFFKEFGEAIKSGIYSEWDAKEKLQDLLIFSSSASEKLSTLEEYVARMKEGQENIYFVAGTDRTFIEKLPQMEAIREKGYEVLYLFDRIDEFVIERMMDYKGKKFKSIARGELNLEKDDKETKDKYSEKEKESKTLLEKIKESLKDKVKDVKLSTRLKSSAVCLVSEDSGISFGMEKVMAGMPNLGSMKASRILEINPEHKLFEALKNVHEKNPDAPELADYSFILYNQALLIEGLPVDDPVEFSNKLTELMIRTES